MIVIVLVAETVLMARNFALSVTDAHTVILVYIQAAHQNMATVCATRVAAWVWEMFWRDGLIAQACQLRVDNFLAQEM